MKRLIAFIIILNIFLSSLTVTAESGTALVGSNETAKPGETVSVTLKLQDNPGLAAWKIELTWDDATLELDKGSIKLDKDFSNGLFVENSEESGKLILVWANVKDVKADGSLVTLNFDVADTAAEGIHSISVNTSGTKNQDGDKIMVTTTDIYINLQADATGVPEDTPSAQEPVARPSSPSREDPEDDFEEASTLPSGSPNEEIVIPDASFSDVFADAYYYLPVQWAVAQRITAGTSATTFSPESPCNRAQMVTFLWRAAGCPIATENYDRFTDIDANSYYYDAVIWAVSRGITSGTSENTFSPDAPVTRGQVVTFLWRYAGWDYSVQENPFNDIATDAYYESAVSWAVAKSITTGTSDNTFSPDITCSRGQIVTFLYRYFVS